MAEPHQWTAEEDAAIARANLPGGETYQQIATRMGKARWTIRQRAATLGVLRRWQPPVIEHAPNDDDRGPLPPGHPLTWGTLTAGTCLEGQPYA